MIKAKYKEITFEIEESFLIIVLICIFSKMIRGYFENYFICFLYVAFHELAHVFVANIFGKKPQKIKLKTCGMNATYTKLNIEYYKKVIVYIAGPLANFILASIFKNVKIVFEINIALALINLIPIFPFDGFNILKSILEYDEKDNNIILDIIQNIFKIIIIFLAIYIVLKYRNYSLMMLIIYVIFININSVKY